MIPGVKLTFGTIAITTDATIITISVVSPVTATVAGRATLKFDEDVTYAGMAAGTYAGGLVTDDPSVYKETNDTCYWTGLTGVVEGRTYTITVYGVTDLAENVGGTSAVPLYKSCVVGAASSTALAP